MINHEFLATAGKGIAALTAGALGFAGCNWVVGDEYPHPIAGRVDAVSAPSYECTTTKYGKDCEYHYYLFVNGCVELPEAAAAYVASVEPDRKPEYGWVDVPSDVWSDYSEGEFIYFKSRSMFNRILADQEDDNHACPIPTN